MTKLALSSITITAGSVFLSTKRFDIKRITTPNEKIQMILSYSLKISSTMFFVFFSNQIIPSEKSVCLDWEETEAEGIFSFILLAILIPFLVIQIIATVLLMH